MSKAPIKLNSSFLRHSMLKRLWYRVTPKLLGTTAGTGRLERRGVDVASLDFSDRPLQEKKDFMRIITARRPRLAIEELVDNKFRFQFEDFQLYDLYPARTRFVLARAALSGAYGFVFEYLDDEKNELMNALQFDAVKAVDGNIARLLVRMFVRAPFDLAAIAAAVFLIPDALSHVDWLISSKHYDLYEGVTTLAGAVAAYGPGRHIDLGKHDTPFRRTMYIMGYGAGRLVKDLIFFTALTLPRMAMMCSFILAIPPLAVSSYLRLRLFELSDRHLDERAVGVENRLRGGFFGGYEIPLLKSLVERYIEKGDRRRAALLFRAAVDNLPWGSDGSWTLGYFVRSFEPETIQTCFTVLSDDKLAQVLCLMGEDDARSSFGALEQPHQVRALGSSQMERVRGVALLNTLDVRRVAQILNALDEDVAAGYFDLMQPSRAGQVMCAMEVAKGFQDILFKMDRDRALGLLTNLSDPWLRAIFIDSLNPAYRKMLLERLDPARAAGLLEGNVRMSDSSERLVLSFDVTMEAIAAVKPERQAQILGHLSGQENKLRFLRANDNSQMARVFDNYVCRDAIDLMLTMTSDLSLGERMQEARFHKLLGHATPDEFKTYLSSFVASMGELRRVLNGVAPAQIVPIVKEEIDMDASDRVFLPEICGLDAERLHTITSAIPAIEDKVIFLNLLETDRLRSVLDRMVPMELAKVMVPLLSDWKRFETVGGLTLFDRLDLPSKVAVLEEASTSQRLRLLAHFAQSQPAEFRESFKQLRPAIGREVLALTFGYELQNALDAAALAGFRGCVVTQWGKETQHFSRVLNEFDVEGIAFILQAEEVFRSRSDALLDEIDDMKVASVFLKNPETGFSIKQDKLVQVIQTLYASSERDEKLPRFFLVFEEAYTLVLAEVQPDLAGYLIGVVLPEQRPTLFQELGVEKASDTLLHMSSENVRLVVVRIEPEFLENVSGALSQAGQLRILQVVREEEDSMFAMLRAVPETFGSDEVRREMVGWFREQTSFPADHFDDLVRTARNSFVLMNAASHPATGFDLCCTALDRLDITARRQANRIWLQRGGRNIHVLPFPVYTHEEITLGDFFGEGSRRFSGDPASAEYKFANAFEEGSATSEWLVSRENDGFTRFIVDLLPYLYRSIGQRAEDATETIFTALEEPFNAAVASFGDLREERVKDLAMLMQRVLAPLDGRSVGQLAAFVPEAFKYCVQTLTSGRNGEADALRDGLPLVLRASQTDPQQTLVDFVAFQREREPQKRFRRFRDMFFTQAESVLPLVFYGGQTPSRYFYKLLGAHYEVEKYAV